MYVHSQHFGSRFCLQGLAYKAEFMSLLSLSDSEECVLQHDEVLFSLAKFVRKFNIHRSVQR